VAQQCRAVIARQTGPAWMGHSRGSAVAMNAQAVLGRLGYGVLFCLVLPMLLVQWAIASRDLVSLPAYGN